MSYNAMGSYYSFAPHEVFPAQAPPPRSLGEYYSTPQPGLSGLDGFGAVDFSASGTWSQWVTCNAVWQSQKKVGPTCAPAANRIRAGLSQLGYGPFTLGQPWGTGNDRSSYAAFVAAEGISKTPGMASWWPSKQSLERIEELIAEQKRTGKTPGPNPVKEFHETPGGNFIPGPVPGQKALKAGLSGGKMALLGGVALALIGGVTLLRKKGKGRKGSLMGGVG